MVCIIFLQAEFWVQYDDILAADIDEFLVCCFVALGFTVVEGIADIIDTNTIDPFHYWVKFLLDLLTTTPSTCAILLLMQYMIIFDHIKKCLIDLYLESALFSVIEGAPVSNTFGLEICLVVEID